MAAYAALLSVKYIIEQLQQHPRPPISIDQNLTQSLIEKVTLLQDFLEVYSYVRNEEVDRLQSRIADSAYAAEDVIESGIVVQILTQSTAHAEWISGPFGLYQGLQKVIQDMDLIRKEVMEIKERGPQDQKHVRSSIPAATSFRYSSIGKNTMVGFDDVLVDIMDKLTQRQVNRQIISIVGMGGIGKTTLAKNIYENPLIVQNFDVRAWTIISQEYQVREIFLKLLLWLRKEYGLEILSGKSEQELVENLCGKSKQELGEILYQNLCGRRYLIIMDDIWNIEVWDQLKRYFPQDICGNGIIITSRLSNLNSLIPGVSCVKMNFLNEHKSWDLFCKIVFGEDCCPFELEKIGKKIVENCLGLPLSIVVIGGLLAKSEQTQYHWEYIAKNLNSVVSLEDNERCLSLLYMSYNYLPIHLRPCFLYMGIFSEDEKIHASELIKLWVAEGFLKPISGKNLEEVAQEYLKALVERNLILVDEWRHNGEIKLCKMHDLLRELCLREAKKDKFLCTKRLQNINNSPQDINIQRRIAFHGRPILFHRRAIPGRNALQSMTLARSLICISPKILSSVNSGLSRILTVDDTACGESLSIEYPVHWEHFSIEYPVHLVNLRYLTFIHFIGSMPLSTIPSSLYLFWNLQTLIDDRCMSVNFDVWKMPLLRHVKFTRLRLKNPERDDLVLENLPTLSYLQDFKFSEEVISKIPNIRKLKLTYSVATLPTSHYCLHYLSHLHKLESLWATFPQKSSLIDSMHNLTFPHSLKKLTLHGCRLPWKDMSTKIGSLPHLQVLELVLGSFIGLEWETVSDQFRSLKFLMINDCHELECWITEAAHFPCLEHLSLHMLYNLKEIPSDLGNIPTLKLIEIRSCSEAAKVFAEEIAEEQDELGNQDLQVRVDDTPYEP